ncbi:MAG: hypothetical protein KatS3mg105_3065 [Gemmatales bacterium]|nr:MAG: hypothetical protein KatS3mg105_3065 [Gemmatales bacterium]
MEVLAKALLRAVRLGHDNELFVLLFDGAFADPGDLEKLERAVQVAVGKHHQVMVVCPLASTADGTPLESSHQRQTESEQALHRLKSRFARFHVPVVSARRDDSVRLILNRIDQLRMVTR